MSEPANSLPELPAAAHVSADRQELHAWLFRRSPDLGDLYAGALELVFGPKIRGRVRFIAHALREIANRLPDVIGGPEGALGANKRVNPSHHLDAIAKIWGQIPENLARSMVDGEREPSPTSNPLTPQLDPRVFGKIDELISGWIESKKTAPQRMEALIMTLAPENRSAPEVLAPIKKQWSEITRYFVAVAHGKQVTEDELVQQFALFERTLLNLSGSFYPRLDELDEILGRANS